MWPDEKQLIVVALYCVTLARLNCISQNSLSYVFLVGVGHMRDTSGIFGGQKYSNSHFVLTHTVSYLLKHLIVVRRQSDLQLFHPFLEWNSVSLALGPDVYI